MKKEVISKTETSIVDGKKQTVVKEGKLTAEEKARYKPMIKDVKRNTNSFFIRTKKFIRWTALNIM
jgi:hypothetical protein